MPRYFKQNKMSSFVRQVRESQKLNMYDFHKRTSADGREHVFVHPLFQKGRQEDLINISRKKNDKRSSKESFSTESTITSKQRRMRFLEEVDSLD